MYFSLLILVYVVLPMLLLNPNAPEQDNAVISIAILLQNIVLWAFLVALCFIFRCVCLRPAKIKIRCLSRHWRPALDVCSQSMLANSRVHLFTEIQAASKGRTCTIAHELAETTALHSQTA